MWHATQHAIEQFIRRWEPAKSYPDAEEELLALLETSSHAGKTIQGESIVVSGERPEIRMVIKDRNVCITVLPHQSVTSNERELENVVALFETNADKLKEEIASLEEQTRVIDKRRGELGLAKSETMRKIAALKDTMEKEVAEIDAKRRELGIEKTNLLSKMQMVKNKLRAIEY